MAMPLECPTAASKFSVATLYSEMVVEYGKQIGSRVPVPHVRHAVNRPVASAHRTHVVRFIGPAERIHTVIPAIIARLDSGRELDQHQGTVVECRQVEYLARVHHPAGGSHAARIH
jgi:hypothetical protein